MTTCKISDIISPVFAEPHRAIRDGAVNELVAKGGRGSCKSSFVSVELVLLLLRHPNCHAVALRKVANTLLNSVYAQICWAIAELGLTDRFRCTRNPMACTYLPTGQKIMFFGLDDPGKLKSIKVPFGYIGMGWFEELDQFDGPEQVRNVEQSIFRGGEFAFCFKSFNPPAMSRNWANRYVIERKAGRIVHHSTYLTTPPEWLGSKFLNDAQHLQETNETAYRHEYMGEVVGSGTSVFENLRLEPIADSQIAALDYHYFGQDWGWYPDPNHFAGCAYDSGVQTLYIYEEYRGWRQSNAAWSEKIKHHMDDIIMADPGAGGDRNALHSAYSYEDAFQAKDCTSRAMQNAIQQWFRLYYERESDKESDPCQRLAYTIVRKLTKTVFGEYNAASGNVFVQKTLDALNTCKKSAVQLALIGGEAWLKPMPVNDEFVFSVISRSHILIFGRDGLGRPTDIGTAEYTVEGRNWYTLLERRRVDANGYLTIRNKLYCSAMPDMLGQPVPLKTLARYADLPDEYTFPQVIGGLGLAWVKTPLENCVDGSRDGVSVYAPAAGLIRNIDRNEALLNGEFERGQSRIIASDDLLRKGRDGRRGLSDNIFVGIDDDPETVGLTIFSPALREQSFLARKQEYLRTAENIIGLKRGLLSEAEAAERTATEITSSAGDYNLTVIDFQQMWETAVRECVQICGRLGQLYKIPGACEVEENAVSIDWGNGILYDEDKTWADYMSMVSAGMLKPEIALGWRFGMPVETEGDLAAIRAKYMPTLNQLADGDG